MNQWCILRCAGRSTLKLAERLDAAGIPAWTPIETIKRRPPRSKVWERKLAPVLPTFVFAAADRLSQLIRLADDYSTRQRPPFIGDELGQTTPDFSVFRHHDRFPLVDDRELSALRAAERKGTPIDTLPRFNTGDRVTTDNESFQGLTGIVEKKRGKFILVAFPGFAMPVTISPLNLAGEHVSNIAEPAGRQAT